MNGKVFVVIMAVICFSLSLSAQDKWKFGSQNYAGLLEGESGTAFQLQSINGLRYKTWFAGVGTGLDYYVQRSIPVFLSVSKYLPAGKLPVYVNADAGINFPWNKKDVYYIQDPGTLSSSLYWAGGLGYKFGSKKRTDGVLLNFGYSFKRLINETTYTNPCLVPPCPVSTERYDYRLRRLSVKLGWKF